MPNGGETARVSLRCPISEFDEAGSASANELTLFQIADQRKCRKSEFAGCIPALKSIQFDLPPFDFGIPKRTLYATVHLLKDGMTETRQWAELF